MKYTCEPRKCISCDTQIHLPGESFQEKIARGIYKEITLELSNDSKMRVGICNICIQKSDEIDLNEVLEAIKERWRKTIRPSRKEELEKTLKDLKVKQLVS